MIRTSPRRSGGSIVIFQEKFGHGQITVSSEFVAVRGVMPTLDVHDGNSGVSLTLSPEDLIDLGKELIAEGISLQQRPQE